MFLVVFLMTLFALTVLAAVERSVAHNRQKKSAMKHAKIKARADRECEIYRACMQALKNP